MNEPTTAADLAVETLSFSSLPALRAAIDGGTFQGITTLPDGTHCAVIFLAIADQDRDHKGRLAWAKELGGVLPTRAIFNLVLTTLATDLPLNWYGTSEEYGASDAWHCRSSGSQGFISRSAEGGAVAVRLIPLTA